MLCQSDQTGIIIEQKDSLQAIFQIHIREVSKLKNTIIETGLLRPFLVKIVFAKEKDAFFFYKERIQNLKLMTLSIYKGSGDVGRNGLSPKKGIDTHLI